MQRPRVEIDVSRQRLRLFKKGLAATRQQFLEVYVKLQKLGFGNIVASRNEAVNHDAFKLSKLNTIALGQLALGTTPELMESTEVKATPRVPYQSTPLQLKLGSRIVRIYGIPDDANKKELKELGEHIEALADLK